MFESSGTDRLSESMRPAAVDVMRRKRLPSSTGQEIPRPPGQPVGRLVEEPRRSNEPSGKMDAAVGAAVAIVASDASARTRVRSFRGIMRGKSFPQTGAAPLTAGVIVTIGATRGQNAGLRHRRRRGATRAKKADAFSRPPDARSASW